MEPKRYIGLPSRQLPAEKLPSRADMLRLIHSYGNMKGVQMGKLHCPFVGIAGTTVGCTGPGGCNGGQLTKTLVILFFD
jgi:hypothetical protein